MDLILAILIELEIAFNLECAHVDALVTVLN